MTDRVHSYMRASRRDPAPSVLGGGGTGESSSSVLSAIGFLPLAFGFMQLGGGGIGLLLRGDLLLPLVDAIQPDYEQIEPVAV